MTASGTGGGVQPPEPGGPPVRSGVASARSVLSIRPFRRLWAVLSVAALADWVGVLATAIFATFLVEGPLAKGAAFGGAIGIRLLPAMVLGTMAGVSGGRLARRWTRRGGGLARVVR